MSNRLTPRDWLAAELANAIRDVRAKLVDEAWFGRRTADQVSGMPQDHNRNADGQAMAAADAERTRSPLGWEQPRESNGPHDLRQSSFEELWGPREKGSADAEKTADHSLSRELER